MKLTGAIVHCSMMRVAFLGLGGVGGYLGAKMAREYASSRNVEIIFFARDSTAETIRANGIKLITPQEEFVAHPHKVYTASDRGPVADYLVCCVKSYDLEESLMQFCAFIGQRTVILPLQNGIDATERGQTLCPFNEVWNGCAYIVSRIQSPGIVKETGNIHTFHFGARHGNKFRLIQFRDVLIKAHAEVHLHQNIDEICWEKFIFISTIASLTSYLDVCIGKILEHESNRKLLETLLLEIITVAKAEKVLLREDIIPATIAKMEKLPYETTSSMHSDFRAGHRTEIDSLTAQVVELAERHGIPVPAYTKILKRLRRLKN